MKSIAVVLEDPLPSGPKAVDYVVAPLNSTNATPFVHVQFCGVVGFAF